MRPSSEMKKLANLMSECTMPMSCRRNVALSKETPPAPAEGPYRAALATPSSKKDVRSAELAPQSLLPQVTQERS